jgi:prepilin-type N-terminal cleavage/methylation domain-containing protein
MMQTFVLITCSRTRLKCRGFTLTELAIVLLIVSFVIGAIWVAAEPTWDNYRASRAAQQVTKITQNIREYYMNAQKLPWASGADITKRLDQLSLFPDEMRRNPTFGPGGTPIDHPFNGTLVSGAPPANGSFHAESVTCTNGTPLTSTCFRLRMLGLEQGACMRLLEAIPVNDADLGIVGVGTQNMVTFENKAASMTSVPSPVVASTARTWCNQTGANNEVDWDFKLHN